MPISHRHAVIKFPAQLTAEEVAAWDSFLQAMAVPSPFMSFQFALAVANSGRDARVCIIREGQEIAAFFPFQYANRWSRLAKAAERLGQELCDSFGVVARTGFQTTTTELLRLADLNYLSFSHLDEAQAAHGLHGELPRIGLRIKLRPEVEQPLLEVESVTRHYLKDSAKRTRKLVDEIGPMAFEFDVREERHSKLNALIESKRRQYQAGGVPDSFAEEWKRKTLQQLCDTSQPNCRGVLSTLHAGDQWIASHFGMLGGGVLHLWFPVYNPEYARYSPGRLLLHHLVQSCTEHAFHTIDRGEGDTPRKREIANEEYLLYRGVWRNKSPAGAAAYTVDRLKWKFGM